MPCRLRDDLHAITMAGRTILLDARQNRYFGLAAPADLALQRLRGSPADPADARLLAPLVEAGLLVGDPANACLSVVAAPSAPTDELPVAERPPLLALLRCLTAHHRARRLLRQGDLAVIGTTLRAARLGVIDRTRSATLATLSEQAAAFAWLEPLFPRLDHCLPNALACCLAACRAGVAAELVIGVRANPFAAHAWAQAEIRVLNDTIERVRQFAPIMAL